MVKSICINDSNKPKEIPEQKWIKKDNEYTITHIFIHPNQGGIQGVHLKELTLKDCGLYETYKLSRFAFKKDDLQELIQLAKLCSELDEVTIELLLKEEIHENI